MMPRMIDDMTAAGLRLPSGSKLAERLRLGRVAYVGTFGCGNSAAREND